MVTKNWKKVIALLAAVSVVTAGIPGITKYASATGTGTDDAGAATDETAEGGDAAGAEGGDAEGGEAENPREDQEVLEDGEVVMKNAVGRVPKSEWITLKDYELIAETDSYKMYLYEPRLSIMLENKETGKFIESTLSDELDDGNSNRTWNSYMKSGIVLEAIDNYKSGTPQSGIQVDLITNEHTLDVTKSDNGFSAKLYFSEYQIGLTVNVTLEGDKGDELVISIPDDSVVEDGEKSCISKVIMFPFMGYTSLEREKNGYMLIPDGNGALIYLNNKEGRYTTGFSQMIYGSDVGFEDSTVKTYLWDELDMVRGANEVIAPIFGVADTDDQIGYLAVVEKGEKRASIDAQPNGAMVNYNRCFATFLLRDVFVQPLNNSNSGSMRKAEDNRTKMDMQVRYILLSGEDANYSTMAVKYREYLLNNGLLETKDTSYNTRVDFLGTEREEFLLGTKAVTMTTTENIEDMYQELKKSGVSSLLTLYKGWQKGGLYNVPITKYKADSHIGGTSKLTSLIKDAAEQNYNIYLYNDALRLNPDTNTMNLSMIKQVNKRNFEEEVWAEVYNLFYYLIPSRAASNIEKFVDSYTGHGVSNLALSGISDTMFSYSLKGKYYTRNDTAADYAKVLDEIDKNTNLMLEKPSAYLWKNTDAFLDMPLGTSDYMYVDEEIPFLSMVLKGVIPMYSDYVNFEANKEEFFLQMVESGVYPSFYLTYEDSSKLIYTNSAYLYSTRYSVYKDTVVEYDQKLREVNDAVKDALIVKHEKRDNGVTVVTYSNGVKIYVNFTSTSHLVDDITVEGMSYSIVR